MRTEDIITTLNEYIEQIRFIKKDFSNSHFIVQTNVEQCTTFNPTIKEIRHELWLVDNGNTYSILVSTSNYKITNDEDLQIALDKSNLLLLKQIFELIANSFLMDLIINGVYGRDNTN